MGKFPKGKNNFYKKLKIDSDTKRIIRFYNDMLRSWQGKEEYIDFDKLGGKDEKR